MHHTLCNLPSLSESIICHMDQLLRALTTGVLDLCQIGCVMTCCGFQLANLVDIFILEVAASGTQVLGLYS